VTATDRVHETVNAVYVAESRRVLATLIRLLGDFDAAEEAMHDAFRAALEQWPRDGVPGNPRAWLVSRPFWTSIAIVAMWTAVIVDAIAGTEIVAVATTATTTTTTNIPTVVITGLLAAIATIFVARYGFAPERRDG